MFTWLGALKGDFFIRHRVVVALLAVVACRCAVVVADSLSLRAEVVDNLFGQACVFGWTHASVDACSLTLLLPDDAFDVA